MDDLDVMGLCIYYDRTMTTYKYSLFLSLVDICKNYPSLPKIISKDTGERVEIPIGIMVWRWINYYYPYYNSDKFISIGGFDQSDSKRKTAIRELFKELIREYGYSDGQAVLYKELFVTGIPKEKQPLFVSLITSIRKTIVTQVMKQFGKSCFNNEYPVFKIESYNLGKLITNDTFNKDYLVNELGTFSIPASLYEEICNQDIETIYDKTRVIENWIKCLIDSNQFLEDDVEMIQSLIPSIPGDNKFHSFEYIQKILTDLKTDYSVLIPPGDLELNDSYNSVTYYPDEESIEDFTENEIVEKLESSLKKLTFSLDSSRIISMLFVYGDLPISGFKVAYKNDKLKPCLDDLLEKGTISKYEKNNVNGLIVTYYSLNKDVSDAIRDIITDMKNRNDMLHKIAENLSISLKDIEEYKNKYLDMPIYINKDGTIPLNFNIRYKILFISLVEYMKIIGFSEEEGNILVYLECNNNSTVENIEKLLYNRNSGETKAYNIIEKLRKSGYLRINKTRENLLNTYSLTTSLNDIYLKKIDADYRKFTDAEREIVDIENLLRYSRTKK